MLILPFGNVFLAVNIFMFWFLISTAIVYIKNSLTLFCVFVDNFAHMVTDKPKTFKVVALSCFEPGAC